MGVDNNPNGVRPITMGEGRFSHMYEVHLHLDGLPWIKQMAIRNEACNYCYSRWGGLRDGADGDWFQVGDFYYFKSLKDAQGFRLHFG